jgi:hypothetical protein
MNGPNDALAALIAEADAAAGCSWAGLARRINRLGAEQGVRLRYDYTAVNRWVKRGERPRPPVPSLIAQALSEKLGRTVLPADFDMPDDESLAARGLSYLSDPRTTMETVAELGRADVNRRQIVKAPFVLAALAVPSRDWLLATLDELAGERGSRKVGMQQVQGIRDMFRLFQEMDVMRGGGHARSALIEYMNSYVLPLVTREGHPAQLQTAIYEAAAEQAYLVGWMAYDDGQHGLAQRYLIQALRLAQASGHAALGAHVLAGMSDQANLLGHPREALMLARAGQRGISAAESPACLADLHILEARAYASLRDAKAASAAVTKAESTFEGVDPANEPEWARFIDRAYLFGEAALCFRDLGQPDQIDRFGTASDDDAKRQGRARRGALSQAALATADIQRGEIEAAATRGMHVIDLAATVYSARARETVRDLQRRLAHHSHEPAVQQFNAKARTALGLVA